MLPELLERFQPRTVLASTTGGDVRFSGVIAGLLRSEGTLAEASAMVKQAGGGAQLIEPVPGVAYDLPVG